eukprot:scaffold159136_cov41-Prasinocladus_malaysianus.AAC.1
MSTSINIDVPPFFETQDCHGGLNIYGNLREGVMIRVCGCYRTWRNDVYDYEFRSNITSGGIRAGCDNATGLDRSKEGVNDGVVEENRALRDTMTAALEVVRYRTRTRWYSYEYGH